jgi:DNA-binding NarL/FixJ family response regulator
MRGFGAVKHRCFVAILCASAVPPQSDPLPVNTTMTKIRIAIADDDDMVRSALRRYLMQEADFHWAGEASDGTDAILLVQSAHIDVLLLDVSMPRMGGLQALPLLRAGAPHTRVIMLSSHADPGYQRRALQLGAVAYLLKGGDPQVIAHAIRAAMP